MTFDPQEQARAMALLRTSGRMADATEREPDPAVRAIGARAGLGFSWADHSATAAVYEFDTYRKARKAEDRLAEAHDGPRRVSTSVNGSLLLIAAADADDPDAQQLVDDMVAAFPGRE